MRRLVPVSCLAAALLALALIALAPSASAAFHFRLPSRPPAPHQSPSSSTPPAPHPVFSVQAYRRMLAHTPLAFPEGAPVFSSSNPESGATFSSFDTALPPAAALEAAVRALEAAGWLCVFSSRDTALFENGAGRCAAAAAIESRDGAPRRTVVAFLVQK